MEWYYAQNGTQKGPLSEADLKNLLASGEVAQTDLVWHEGMAEWTLAAQVSALASTSASVAPPATTAAASAGGTPYQTPTAQNPLAGNAQNNVHIPSYLWQSIVVTLFCCLIGGIIAIVYAAKVDGLKAAGDIAGAQAASKSAKTWCWVSFGVGLVVTVAYILLMFVTAAGGAASGPY